MKILVTGSSGFIGFHLAKKLLSLGHKVTGIDNENSYYSQNLKKQRREILCEEKNFEFHRLDINDNKFTELINERFDIVIHLAAQAGVRDSDKLMNDYVKNNIDGFINIIKFAKSNSQKFIFASSSSVYSSENYPSKESMSDLRPNSFYGLTKKFNEDVAAFFADANFRVIGLRFFTVYGSFGRPDMAYFRFTRNITRDEEVILFDKGIMQRDMTHINDTIDGILLSIDHLVKEKDIYEIFNLGGSQPISTLALAEKISKFYRKPCNYRHEKSIGESKKTESCNEKSSRILGYEPKIDLHDGLVGFFHWFNKFYGIKK